MFNTLTYKKLPANNLFKWYKFNSHKLRFEIWSFSMKKVCAMRANLASFEDVVTWAVLFFIIENIKHAL